MKKTTIKSTINAAEWTGLAVAWALNFKSSNELKDEAAKDFGNLPKGAPKKEKVKAAAKYLGCLTLSGLCYGMYSACVDSAIANICNAVKER